MSKKTSLVKSRSRPPLVPSLSLEAETWLPWPTLFRRTARSAAPCPTSGSKLHTLATRRANTSAFNFLPNRGEKLRKSHFFTTLGCSARSAADDFDRLTSLALSTTMIAKLLSCGYVKCATTFAKGPNRFCQTKTVKTIPHNA